MENSKSNKNDDLQERPASKSTEDVANQIETVTPDTEKDGSPNDREVTPIDMEDAQPKPHDVSEGTDNPDAEEKENKNPEMDAGRKVGDAPDDIETVSA